MQRNKKTFKGQNIYIGIDVHTNKLAPCVVDLTLFVCSWFLDNFPYFFSGKKRDYLCEKC